MGMKQKEKVEIVLINERRKERKSEFNRITCFRCVTSFKFMLKRCQPFSSNHEWKEGRKKCGMEEKNPSIQVMSLSTVKRPSLHWEQQSVHHYLPSYIIIKHHLAYAPLRTRLVKDSILN
ncbi:hypothetical protein GLYMA_16G216400v4 [Glycine max]|uniref:Uncharacterized protein n=1 Tax=Glycine max TaxID=3847 RepID=A0A0R0G2X3_SOYBN|nr:hypothetical protein JHK85_046548 [Glycine max]KAH1152352.1 hypothetical protein GYH30_045710 [Glycine max]KRH09451.1 hypothetical protein GLYMA_16G216400v4 [Glycine max]